MTAIGIDEANAMQEVSDVRRGETLAVVIPVYNEEKAIDLLLQQWLKELRSLNIDFKIHAYDDGSRDTSLQLLKKWEKRTSEVVVHTHANKGHGPTILGGYRDNVDADWIFQIDSDNEISVDHFKTLWTQRDGRDFLVGARMYRNQSMIRKTVSFVSRLLVHTLSQTSKIQDVNSPYRLMRVQKFKGIFSCIPKNTFAPNLLVSMMALLGNLRVFEVGVPHQNRLTGICSLDMKKLLKSSLLSFVQTLLFRLRRSR